MRNTAVNIALVGGGTMGALHARIVAQSQDAELTCIVDPSRERGERLAERWRSRWTPTLDSFSLVDAVIVASPTPTHLEWARKAIAEGKPVLVEKPIAECLEDVSQLVADACAAGVPFMCGLLERFNPAVLTALELIDEPLHLTAVRHSTYVPRIVTGIAHDLLIHDVDIVTRIMGSAPDTVKAQFGYVHPKSVAGAEDIAEVNLGYNHSLLAALSVSRIAQRKVRSLTIFELERMVEVDLIRQDATVYRHVGADFFEGKTTGMRQQTIIDIPIVQNAREPLVGQFEHFLALIDGRADIEAEAASVLLPHAVVAKIIDLAERD